MNPCVKSVKVLSDYQLLIIFTNDEIGLYDCKPLLNFGVFKELQDIEYFNQVSIVGDTVTWVNEQDICPDTLYLESNMVDEITGIWYELMSDINSGDEFCSSEKTLVFHFAWRLKDKYRDEIKLDFEKNIFENNFSGNTWLDLYVILNDEKIGFEFKFKGNTNTTNTHIDVVHDIKRLSWLKEQKKIDKGYFLYATNSKSAMNEVCAGGRDRTAHLDFITHHSARYEALENNKIKYFPKGKTSSTESNETVAIPHNIIFKWNGIKLDKFKEHVSSGKYAWLTPIII
ncbi:MAG: DUF2442 domain-containing protein [Methyloprofundus sp.]|nr:DUF2442 domain-containing protein [Methyloprofundus sp.]